MGRSAAGDEVDATVPVEVGGQGIFDGHAAVVDHVPHEGETVAILPGVVDEQAGAARGPLRILRGIALADQELFVPVSVEVGTPDGVAPGERLIDDATVP